MRPILPKITTVCAALSVAQAVLVTKHSPCETKCGNVLESTSQSDIACGDNSFGAGDSQIFKSCVECEVNSHFVGADNQTDVTAALCTLTPRQQSFVFSSLTWHSTDNMRYAVSSCLFGVPGKDHMLDSNPCVTK